LKRLAIAISIIERRSIEETANAEDPVGVVPGAEDSAIVGHQHLLDLITATSQPPRPLGRKVHRHSLYMNSPVMELVDG